MDWSLVLVSLQRGHADRHSRGDPEVSERPSAVHDVSVVRRTVEYGDAVWPDPVATVPRGTAAAPRFPAADDWRRTFRAGMVRHCRDHCRITGQDRRGRRLPGYARQPADRARPAALHAHWSYADLLAAVPVAGAGHRETPLGGGRRRARTPRRRTDDDGRDRSGLCDGRVRREAAVIAGPSCYP